MFSINNLLIEGKSRNIISRSVEVKPLQDCDISMKSFITVHYDTTGITFKTGAVTLY